MSKNRSKGNDFIFNLSLSEVAFIIILALVLLLGWPLKEKLEENKDLQNVLKESVDENKKLQVCKLLPEDPQVDPDRPETQLLPCDRCVANVRDISLEDARQIREIGEMTKVILTRVKDEKEASKRIQQLLQQSESNKIFIQKIDSLESENKKLKKVLEVNGAREKSLEQNNKALKEAQKLLKEENSRLQLVNNQLNNKLAYGDIYPPCMQGQTKKKNGSPDKWDSLFKVFMREKDVVVRLSNPNTLNHPALDSEIRGLATELVELSKEKYISWSEFDKYSRRIDDWAAHQEPRCRMVVLMYNRIKDAAEADEKRLNYIEDRFYKEEMSRRLVIDIPEPKARNQGDLKEAIQKPLSLSRMKQ